MLLGKVKDYDNFPAVKKGIQDMAGAESNNRFAMSALLKLYKAEGLKSEYMSVS
jgi:hypothetical protein